MYFQLRRLESGLTRHLFDKEIEWIARVLIGIVHHNVDKCRHHKPQDLSAVPNLRPVDAAVLGRAAAYEFIAQNIELIKDEAQDARAVARPERLFEGFGRGPEAILSIVKPVVPL